VAACPPHTCLVLPSTHSTGAHGGLPAKHGCSRGSPFPALHGTESTEFPPRNSEDPAELTPTQAVTQRETCPETFVSLGRCPRGRDAQKKPRVAEAIRPPRHGGAPLNCTPEAEILVLWHMCLGPHAIVLQNWGVSSLMMMVMMC
jgi:hypothetical protein